MIYHCYWTGCSNQHDCNYSLRMGKIEYPRFHKADNYPLLARLIKEGKGDQFVFITTRAQHGHFLTWQEKNGLVDHVTTATDKIVNHNYPEEGPKLFITVFSNKE